MKKDDIIKIQNSNLKLKKLLGCRNKFCSICKLFLTKEETIMSFNEKMMKSYGKALHEGVKFWVPVEAEELINYKAEKLSDMIVNSINFKKKIDGGELKIDDIIEKISFQVGVADDILGWRLDLRRDMAEARDSVVCEPEIDIKERERLIENIRNDMDRFPVQKLKKMLSDNLVDLL